METIYGVVNSYLVDQPTISTFEWKPNKTPFSSLQFLILTVLTYLLLTFLLLHRLLPTPSLPSSLLRLITTFHNLTILLISLLMAISITLSSLTHLPHLSHLFCFPSSTSPSGPLFFWAYVFYLSKILEFLDTLFIFLSGADSVRRRLSFLHVYHHATVVVMCYLWLETRQSLFPVALATNAAVHTVMYAYYLLSGLGIRPRWKRAVTDFQIVQFVFSFLVSGAMLYHHFGGAGCSGIWGWCFNAVFNASLLYLFIDFHSKNYKGKEKEMMVKKKKKLVVDGEKQS